MRRRFCHTKIILLTILIFLSACEQKNSPHFSVLFNNRVQGIEYVGSNAQGIANGEFEYSDGDILTFKIGDIRLGSVRAEENISPTMLGGIAANADSPYIASDKTINLVRFLISIASNAVVNEQQDVTVANSIVIDEATRAAGVGLTVNFEVPTAEFETSPQLQTALSTLTQHMANPNRKLASVETAITFIAEIENDIHGRSIPWKQLIAAQHGKQLSYHHQELVDGNVVNDETLNSYFMRSKLGPYDIWLQQWSDNNSSYPALILDEIIDQQVYMLGDQYNGEEQVLPYPLQLYSKKSILDSAYLQIFQWQNQLTTAQLTVKTPVSINTGIGYFNNATQLNYKAVNGEFLSIQWYVPDIGLVKRIDTIANAQQILDLKEVSTLNEIPLTPSNEPYFAINELIAETDKSIENLATQFEDASFTLFAYYSLFNLLDSEEHRSAFHNLYLVYATSVLTNLSDTLTTLTQSYKLDGNTVSFVISEKAEYVITAIALHALIHQIENRDMLNQVINDVIDIASFHINLLNAANITETPLYLSEFLLSWKF